MRFLCPIVSDRFAAIHDVISEWQKQDPRLNDEKGFLEYLKTRDIGQFNVGNTKRWLEYLREAKKRRVTVEEILFESRKKMLDKKLEYERDPSREIPEKVYIFDQEKLRELAEIDKRLKTYDPARVKRRNR